MLWFRRPDAVLPNLALIGYLFVAWPLALYGMSRPLWFAPAVLLMAHVLVLCAYLLHDCLHNAVFAANAANERLGRVLAWLTGAVYSPYALLREKHFRHHVERADILAVDHKELLRRFPLLSRCVRQASRACLPAVELLMHALEFAAPFYLPQRRNLRVRNLSIFAVRAALFVLLCHASPLAALGYLVAWVLFVAVMGFMDAFQHTYDVHYRLLEPQRRPAHDRDYEEANTYSNLLSSRWRLPNLLVLNFCFHNVHHHRPSEPWYRLPALHASTYPEGCPQHVPLRSQMTQYLRERRDQARADGAQCPAGADGVSFLVGI